MDEKLPEEISFGEWLHQRRRLLDLTQQQLADQIGCARITLRRIEAGALKPSKEMALILLEKLRAPQADREAWLRFARGLAGFPGQSADALASELSTNLPTLVSSFIGREKEQDEIKNLLAKNRLVTLTGLGGIGKTRLSIQAARESLTHYPDGVWLVEFAPILDPLLVPRTTAITIGLRDEPQRPVIDMLCDYLRNKHMLIILDNCEHLVDACARMADKILQAAPNVRILASSREALGIAGEISYLVPPLKLPDIQHLPPVESLSRYESVRLFTDRAASTTPSFAVTNENALALAQICYHLDGIPLAIELAAAKIRVLSVEQIAERLADRFRLLSGGNRTAIERHQTLQATIDWSCNLLSSAEQVLFRRLSVFVGGWMLEAAESICADESVQSGDILDLLEQLINKSLVMVEGMQGKTRYRMLETIRQYANQKLVESEESNALRDKHLEYFLKLAETAAPHLMRSEQLEWLAQLDVDYENLRLALQWAINKDSPQILLRLCAALGIFWFIRSYWMEGSKWLKNALSTSPQNPDISEKTARVRALYQDARLANQLDDIERLRGSAELSLALAQEGVDTRDIAIARFYVGLAWSRHNRADEARPLMEQSLAEVRELHDAYWEAYSFRELGSLLEAQGECKIDERRLQSLQLARKAGERLNLAEALWLYSDIFYDSNQIDEGLKYVEEADLLYKQIGYQGNPTSIAFGCVAWLHGDYEKARSYFLEVQERLGLLGEKLGRANLLSGFLGRVALDQGNFEQAQAYYEEGLATGRELQDRSFIVFRLAELSTVFYLQGNLDKYKQCLMESTPAAKRLSSHTKRDFLVSVLDSIHIYRPESAAHILGAVYIFERESEQPIGPLTKRYYNLAEAHVRESLGNAIFESAFVDGQNMSLDEALDLVLKTVEELQN